MTPEGKIKAKFNRGLKKIKERGGKLMIRMPVTRGMGKPLLDYLICANSRFVLVEAKRDADHQLTPQQKSTRKECQEAGGIVMVVCDDASITEALDWITALCQM